MKWIGQHIYDLVSRFRSDVYLEDISTGSIASGAHLGLDSNNKIVKAADSGGDLTAIIAGTGLSGDDLSGPIPTLQVDTSQPTITTLAGLTSFGSPGVTTSVAAGDLTMYNNVNDGNPTIKVGSSLADSLEIQAVYNSGGTSLDAINFTTRTNSTSTHDGKFHFYVDETLKMATHDDGMSVYGYVALVGDGALFQCNNQAASSATEGGKLILRSDDGAAMGSGHRLGVIEFEGAEDASNNRTVGARIEAMTDAAWSDTENGARLDFYTTDGNASESKVLTLDSDKLATFTGAVTATGALTGTLATVSQPNITGVGVISTGSWRGTAIASTYLDADTAHLSTDQTFTGTKTLNSFKGTAGATVTNILDEDAMGSDSATALATQQSIKAYSDRARYSYTYLTWSASAVSSMDGADPEWKFPNTVKGIYEEDWTKDENIKATTVGATTFTTSRQTAVNGFVMPHAGECVGFHAHGRNNDSDATFKTGLFHYEGSTVGGTNNGGVDYGATGNTHECTLRWIATAIETEASGGADGTGSHSFKGPCKLVSNTDALAVSAGDVLMPAIMGPDGSDEIYITMSIILKIPIV